MRDMLRTPPNRTLGIGVLLAAAAIGLPRPPDAAGQAKAAEGRPPETRPARPKDAPSRPPRPPWMFGRTYRRWERFFTRPQSASRLHGSIKAAFAPLVAGARRSTVRVYCGGRQVALGAVVDAGGHVVTKASELSGPAECRFYDGKRGKAKVVGVDRRNDLALLKLEVGDFVPIPWARSDDPPVGSWVVTTGHDSGPVSLGVVSVRVRRPRDPGRAAPSYGFLGISFDSDANLARVGRVFPNTAAARAGLRPGDVITAADEKKARTRGELQSYLRKAKPGDEVTLRLRRGEREFDVKAVLGRWLVGRQLNPQEHMGGRLSERSTGFERILQHDTPLRPNECGGPVLDSSGKAVGINIARAGRVESYALPASLVRSLVAKLKARASATQPASKPATRPARPGRRGGG